MKKAVEIFIILIILIGLSVVAIPLLLKDSSIKHVGDKISSSLSQKDPAQQLEWVEGVLTQPVPAGASTTRLGLPARREDIMPDGAPVTGYGVHIGQHVEGLDHVWIPITKGEPVRAMGKGTITNINNIYSDQGSDEYMIYIDYGDGLECSYGEISKPLVKKGQTVKHLDPVGQVRDFYGFEAGEIEIYCEDYNRVDGVMQSATGHMGGRAVSPFDYLNDADRVWLEQAYLTKVINPFLSTGRYADHWHPSEPFLTNKIMVHQPDKLTGEWFLINKKWNNSDYSLVIFIEGNNKYYQGNIARLRIENANMSAQKYVDAPYTYEYEGNRVKVIIEGEHQTFYALGEIIEGAGVDSNGDTRARMKFELSSSPIDEFSDRALMYQERGIYNPRYDTWKMGGWVNYQ